VIVARVPVHAEGDGEGEMQHGRRSKRADQQGRIGPPSPASIRRRFSLGRIQASSVAVADVNGMADRLGDIEPVHEHPNPITPVPTTDG